MTKENPGIFMIIVEDTGMDSGCAASILEECSNHGKVLQAIFAGPHVNGGEYVNSVMHYMDFIEPGPKPGKC